MAHERANVQKITFTLAGHKAGTAPSHISWLPVGVILIKRKQMTYQDEQFYKRRESLSNYFEKTIEEEKIEMVEKETDSCPICGHSQDKRRPFKDDFSKYPRGSFPDKLQALINSYSIENGSNTPDYILAKYLMQCLDAFDMCTRERERFLFSSPKKEGKS